MHLNESINRIELCDGRSRIISVYARYDVYRTIIGILYCFTNIIFNLYNIIDIDNAIISHHWNDTINHFVYNTIFWSPCILYWNQYIIIYSKNCIISVCCNINQFTFIYMINKPKLRNMIYYILKFKREYEI